MKNLIISGSLFIWINVFTIQLVYSQNIKVAILDFKSNSNAISNDEAITLTNKFRSVASNVKNYDVLERSDIENILKEQDFSLSDMCNTSECAVEVGKLLSAEKIILGNIGKVGSTFSIYIKIIDIKTSKIEKDISNDYKGEIDGLLTEIQSIAYNIFDIKQAKLIDYSYKQTLPLDIDLSYQLFEKRIDENGLKYNDTSLTNIYSIKEGYFTGYNSNEAIVIIKHKSSDFSPYYDFSPYFSLWLLRLVNNRWVIIKKICNASQYSTDCTPYDPGTDYTDEFNTLKPSFKIIDINNDNIYEILNTSHYSHRGYCNFEKMIISLNGDSQSVMYSSSGYDNYESSQDPCYVSEGETLPDTCIINDHRIVKFIDSDNDGIYEISEKILRGAQIKNKYCNIIINNTYVFSNGKYKLIKSEPEPIYFNEN